MSIQSQKKIYYLNKKHRKDLPGNYMEMIVNNHKIDTSYKLDGYIKGCLELSDGQILFWTHQGIKILRICGRNLELVKYVPI